MTCNSTKQHLINCEVRYWLRKGYTNDYMLEKLRDDVAKIRGKVGADKLIDRIKWALDNWGKRKVIDINFNP